VARCPLFLLFKALQASELEPSASEPFELRRDAQELVDRVSDAVGTDTTSVRKTLDALGGASPLDVALVLVGFLFALYVVLRPFMPGFRLKRMLFNLDSNARAMRSSTTARWHVQLRTGVYAREDQVFARLGGRAPRELPFDLAVRGLLCLSLPTALGVYFVARGVGAPYFFPPALLFYFDSTFRIGCLLLLVATFRLAWLIRAWQRRNGRRAPTAFEAGLGDGARAGVRDPLLVGALAFLVPYYLARVSGFSGLRAGLWRPAGMLRAAAV
jgi:hypothetical protein